MISIGIDIGGAYTKVFVISDGLLSEKREEFIIRYIPLWKDLDPLEHFLGEIRDAYKPHSVGITMTGELADIFNSKIEGVKRLVELSIETFRASRLYFLTAEGRCVPSDWIERKAEKCPYELAAANWAAGARMVGKSFPNALYIDVGSTTVDIIPIKKGLPAPSSRKDFGRLKTKELLYFGVLRTPLSFLGPSIVIHGESIGIASEFFSQVADVYRVLDLLAPEEYSCSTPDGRGVSKEECFQRIARHFCSDIEEVGKEFLFETARVLRNRQIQLLRKGIERVLDFHGLTERVQVVLTGLGRKVLALPAAEQAGLTEIVTLDELYGKDAALITPAFALGKLVSDHEYIRDEDEGEW